METEPNEAKLQETWDRLVLVLIAEPRAGWEREFLEITRREVERLAIRDDGPGRDG